MNVAIIILVAIFVILLLLLLVYVALFQIWLKSSRQIHEYDEDIIRDYLCKLAESFEYSSTQIPYGRARWFILGSKDFVCTVNDVENLEIFGYSPIRSKIDEEFLEYGLLLTQDGFYFREQIENSNNDADVKYKISKKFFPLKGLWKITCKGKKILLFYPNKIERLNFQFDDAQQKNIVANLNSIIKTGYTADLHENYLEKVIDRLQKNDFHTENFQNGAKIGSIIGLNMMLGFHLKDIQFNAIAKAPQGHGHAAEYANNVIDKIKYPFQKVEQVGRDNVKNGADRIVGNQKIQTKYYAKASGTINAAFDKANGGEYRYKGMQLEVPKDQYNESIQLMKKKIKAGKVPGHSEPDDAYLIIRKGNVTYNEAKLVAKGGNIVSLKYDAIDGAIQSIPAAGISFVLVFAMEKWAGKDTEEAAKSAIYSGVKTILLGAAIYTASQQIGKILTKKIADQTVKNVAANTVARQAAGVISFGITVGPDVFDLLQGRISSQQLLKNSLVAGTGLLGGVAGGAVAGAFLGPVGSFVGAVAGGTLAAVGSKVVLDNYIEDDRIEMFAILKEEFIDIVMAMALSEEEFKEIQNNIFDKKLGERLKDMFQKKQSVKNRMFTRESIIEREVERVISKRTVLAEEDILEAVQIAEKEFAVI
ncbi:MULTISPECIES: hypothetical protein [Streptococcus]|uniref:Inner membrane protein yeeR n=3 Tax=Streptococcus TaxID=1301 RepID=A0AB33U699_STRSU|nr:MULTISPECIES: hypothetical protein [Streptococcus]MCO8179665.1 hypothetical protein [Streptococcus suis]WNY51442.1 hypothetical protein PW252_01930 [Streptococcus sp. 29887]WQC90922.1 hypothetical protein U0695_08125 [Streptococcus suis]CYU83436.1 Inner membrane protein yeeR [Streptococcus suis]CYX99196.1 Inner membrane protein yeeR [Streptococcus suis]